jgi:Protein of unknown function (DUF4231)
MNANHKHDPIGQISALMTDIKKRELVSPGSLHEAIINSSADKASKEYLIRRWMPMVMWWHCRSVTARRLYFGLRRVVVFGGVLIPVLSVVQTPAGRNLLGYPELAASMPLAIAVVSMLVAGCAAWEGVANYGEVWREKRRAAELLKVEGWQFLALAGKYEPKPPSTKDHATAFPKFAAGVEELIAREVGEYLVLFAEKPPGRTPQSGPPQPPC